MAARGELIGISYSPWTEKARWALDHHRIEYDYTEHTLLIGEPAFRWRFKLWTGDFTVPAWIDGSHRLMDSYRIARRADAIALQVGASSTPLVPEKHRESIERINRLTEEALDCTRAIVMLKILKDPEAQAESLPAFIPAPLRGVLRTILVPIAMVYLRWSFYRQGVRPEAELTDHLKRTLEQLVQLYEARSGEFLVGDHFSFADIAFAVSLLGVQPPAAPFYRQGGATRKLWSTPLLQSQFAPQLAWRDQLYQKHRPRRVKPA